MDKEMEGQGKGLTVFLKILKKIAKKDNLLLYVDKSLFKFQVLLNI